MIQRLINRYTFKELIFFIVICFCIFYNDLFYFLAHDEVPPYYGTAMHFYHAGSLREVVKLILNSSYTFGHPFLFPMLYGLGMKVWGVGSFAAKVFIVFISSISMNYVFKLGQLVFRNTFYSILLVLLVLMTGVYQVNFPLFLGDTFLLPFCLAYLYYYLNAQYKTALAIGLIAGITRESFLIFVAAIFVFETLYSFVSKKWDKQKMLTLVFSPFLGISWFLLNKIMYGKFLHTFVEVNTEDLTQSGIRLTLDFFLSNTMEFWRSMLNSNQFLFYQIVLFCFSLIHLRRYKTENKRFVLISLSIFLVTYISLSFFHGFYLRYLLYGYVLIIISNLLWIQNFYRTHYKVWAIIGIFISLIGFRNNWSSPDFGEKAQLSYHETITIQKELIGSIKNIDYVYACFPYKEYLCNLKEVYPKAIYSNCIENLENIKQGERVLFICRNPVDEFNVNYEKYFISKPRKLIYESKNETIENLSSWLYEF